MYPRAINIDRRCNEGTYLNYEGKERACILQPSGVAQVVARSVPRAGGAWSLTTLYVFLGSLSRDKLCQCFPDGVNYPGPIVSKCWNVDGGSQTQHHLVYPNCKENEGQAKSRNRGEAQNWIWIREKVEAAPL